MNVGGHLRNAREARGLTIAAVAAATRIQPRLLEAIERNDLSVVPPYPYARGFVAAFAREVGLDADETVRQYFAQFTQEPVVDDQAESNASRSRPGLPRWWAPAGGAAACLLLIVLLVASRTNAPQSDEPASVGTAGTSNPVGVPVSSQGRQEADARAQHDVSPRPRASRVDAVLETHFPSWISAEADGVREVYAVVPAGRTITLSGNREVELRVGDAGAVLLSVNGGAAVPMGRRGEVRTIRLTPRSTGVMEGATDKRKGAGR